MNVVKPECSPGDDAAARNALRHAMAAKYEIFTAQDNAARIADPQLRRAAMVVLARVRGMLEALDNEFTARGIVR